MREKKKKEFRLSLPDRAVPVYGICRSCEDGFPVVVGEPRQIPRVYEWLVAVDTTRSDGRPLGKKDTLVCTGVPLSWSEQDVVQKICDDREMSFVRFILGPRRKRCVLIFKNASDIAPLIQNIPPFAPILGDDNVTSFTRKRTHPWVTFDEMGTSEVVDPQTSPNLSGKMLPHIPRPYSGPLLRLWTECFLRQRIRRVPHSLSRPVVISLSVPIQMPCLLMSVPLPLGDVTLDHGSSLIH